MAKRQIQFTQEQIEILFKNPYVESINSNTIPSNLHPSSKN